MSIYHQRSTVHGTSACFIGPNSSSTSFTWKLRQAHIHFAATLTTVCTATIQIRHHEGTAYDSVVLTATIATDAGVLQDLLWQPDKPILLAGTDKVSITCAGCSAAAPWAYDFVMEG